MKTKALHFSGLFLLALIVGVFWGTWFTLTRSLHVFSAAEFTHIGQTIIANVAWPMRIIMPSCIVLMLLYLWFHGNKRSRSFYLSLSAFTLLIITLLITLTILVPIDNQIRNWTAETVPANWEQLRERWDMFHTIRTFTSLGAFVCWALPLYRKKRSDSDRIPAI